MKNIFLFLVVTVAAVAAKANLTCSAGSYRIDLVDDLATYSYSSVNIAKVHNVQASPTADGTNYQTDMGFLLTVKGNGQGYFQGIWPNPLAVYDSTNPLVLNCK